MNKKSYQNACEGSTRYLITGGAGFIGSHLAGHLLDENSRVIAIDDLSTGSVENIRHILNNPRFQFVRADIMNENVLDRLASESDTIIHLAAAVGVKLIVGKPVHTIETNIMGTEVVLKTALRYGCRILIASTSEVYGKGSRIPFEENDDVLLGPTTKSRWAYAASKMVDEFLGLAYHSEFGVNMTAMRFFNTIGTRQTGQYGMVVPTFVRQALRNEPLTVYGDGSQSRCFCDVRDVIRAVTVLSKLDNPGGTVVNIGSREEISINDLARMVIKICNSKSDINYISYDKAYAPGFEDMQRRVPDIRRVKDLIGWEPRYSLEQTLVAIRDHEAEKLASGNL